MSIKMSITRCQTMNLEEMQKEGEDKEVNVSPNKNIVNLDKLDLQIVSQMENNRSRVFDEIRIEMIKVAGPLGMQLLYKLIRKVWDEYKIIKDLHIRYNSTNTKKGRQEEMWKWKRVDPPKSTIQQL
jgi:hypothetical protein